MSRRFADDDDWPGEDAPDEWDDAAGDDAEVDEGEVDEADEDEPTVPCPYCRREIHEDALRCPYCEQYISTEDAPRAARPWWLLIGVAACIYAVLRWIW
ncbi:MAG: hypothetical protein WD875_07185 [Pirellulales bacterium]